MPRLCIAGSRTFAAVIGMLAISVISISGLAIRAGEPPSFPTPAADQPEKLSLPAKQKIRDALAGKSSDSENGDGVLEDVLGIIKKRGSILDGSMLDPIDSDPETTEDSVSRMALAAEQMLKAARLLENAGLPDQNRANLVKQMRAEAVKLLSE